MSGTLAAACGMGEGVARAQTGADVHTNTQGLPDAPSVTRNNAVIPHEKRWSDTVEPGQTVVPMTPREKLEYPVREEFRPIVLVPLLLSAGYGVLTDSNPKYGTNPDDFGLRIGAAATDQAITRGLTDGLLPIIFHQDPRYYRQAYGGYVSRTDHALRRVVIAQGDSGRQMFNYSDIVGRGMAAALTQTYYPSDSVNKVVVFKGWGTSLAALAGGNIFEEFWPDFKVKVLHIGH